MQTRVKDLPFDGMSLPGMSCLGARGGGGVQGGWEGVWQPQRPLHDPSGIDGGARFQLRASGGRPAKALVSTSGPPRRVRQAQAVCSKHSRAVTARARGAAACMLRAVLVHSAFGLSGLWKGPRWWGRPGTASLRIRGRQVPAGAVMPAAPGLCRPLERAHSLVHNAVLPLARRGCQER
jgi:hypothetical protein